MPFRSNTIACARPHACHSHRLGLGRPYWTFDFRTYLITARGFTSCPTTTHGAHGGNLPFGTPSNHVSCRRYQHAPEESSETRGRTHLAAPRNGSQSRRGEQRISRLSVYLFMAPSTLASPWETAHGAALPRISMGICSRRRPPLLLHRNLLTAHPKYASSPCRSQIDELNVDNRSVTVTTSTRESGGGGRGAGGSRELSVPGKATDNKPNVDELHADIRHHEANGHRSIRHQRCVPGCSL